MFTNVVVVIPAHNEAQSVGEAVYSVLRAASCVEPLVSVRCVVVADACTDETSAAARQVMRPGIDQVLITNGRSVGAARRLGVRFGLTLAGAQPEHVWLASTDADTLVPETWLAFQLDIAERLGVAAIAGIVTLSAQTEPALLKRFHETYPLPEAGAHGNVHAANLGMSASAYLEAGGWKNQKTNEDQDLWDRIAARCSTASPRDLVVETSERTVGHAPNGFAAYLSSLAKGALR